MSTTTATAERVYELLHAQFLTLEKKMRDPYSGWCITRCIMLCPERWPRLVDQLQAYDHPEQICRYLASVAPDHAVAVLYDAIIMIRVADQVRDITGCGPPDMRNLSKSARLARKMLGIITFDAREMIQRFNPAILKTDTAKDWFYIFDAMLADEDGAEQQFCWPSSMTRTHSLKKRALAWHAAVFRERLWQTCLQTLLRRATAHKGTILRKRTQRRCLSRICWVLSLRSHHPHVGVFQLFHVL